MFSNLVAVIPHDVFIFSSGAVTGGAIRLAKGKPIYLADSGEHLPMIARERRGGMGFKKHMLMAAARKCSILKPECLNRTVQESCSVGCRAVAGVVSTATTGKNAGWYFLDCKTFPNAVL